MLLKNGLMFAEAVSDVLLKGLFCNMSDRTGGFGVGLDPLCLTDVLDNTLKSLCHGHVGLDQSSLFGGVVWDS